jgi:hypothetical protein
MLKPKSMYSAEKRISNIDVYEVIFSDDITSILNSAAQVKKKGIHHIEQYEGQLMQSYLGTLDFFYGKFPKVRDELPSKASLPVKLGPNYYFTVSKAFWDIFKEIVAMVAAYSCILTGELIIGTSTAIIGTREIIKTILSNFHAIDSNGKEILSFTIEYYVKKGTYPIREQIVSHMKQRSSGAEVLPDKEINIILDRLIKTGILVMKSKEKNTIAPGF